MPRKLINERPMTEMPPTNDLVLVRYSYQDEGGMSDTYGVMYYDHYLHRLQAAVGSANNSAAQMSYWFCMDDTGDQHYVRTHPELCGWTLFDDVTTEHRDSMRPEDI